MKSWQQSNRQDQKGLLFQLTTSDAVFNLLEQKELRIIGTK